MSKSGFIIQPKFVALDSAHLAALFGDMRSDQSERRAKASAFLSAFDKSGCVLLLVWHHFQELFSHESEQIVARRIDAIRSLSVVASVVSLTDPTLPGSAIDIEALEVAAVYGDAGATIEAVRDAVAGGLFKLTNGPALVRPFLESWTELRRAFLAQAARTREVVAISRSDFVRNEDQKIVDLLNQPSRQSDEVLKYLAALASNLESDIERRGDRRIADAKQASLGFVQDVEAFSRDISRSENPTLSILEAAGVTLAEVGPDTTVGDIGRSATFRKRLGVINKSLNLPWDDLTARVTSDRLPSLTIRTALDRFRPDTNEWKGSDLHDSHLACLTAYATMTYVDKRTHEALRQARQKVPQVARLLRGVGRASDYGVVLQQLASEN